MGAKVSSCCPFSPFFGDRWIVLPHILTVTGILKGYDQLLNLVLDDVTEELQCELCSRLSNLIVSVDPAASPRATHTVPRPGCPSRSYNYSSQSC